jgi:alpha-mannosidase
MKKSPPFKIHMIGNAHLDPAWMWRMSEGLEAFLATCRSALDRMEETPHFIFTCSSSAHLEFVEQTDPNLFARIQERARGGRWVNVGGWWVEADCNIPSGESFIRQALLGQTYLESRFGRMASVGYCIDSFGHHGNLPTFLRGSGLNAYVFMRPDVQEKSLPSTLFRWVAPSGESVTAYRIPLHYSNFSRSVEEKLAGLVEHPLFTSEHPWMLFYGVGNHGGGPTREQIEQIRSAQRNSDAVLFSDPERFFREVPEALIAVHDEMQPHAI